MISNLFFGGKMEELILFGLTYVFVFIIYQIFIIGPVKKRKKNYLNNRFYLFIG